MAHSFAHSLIHLLDGWLIHWLICWMTYWITNWLYSPVYCLAIRPLAWLLTYSVAQLTEVMKYWVSHGSLPPLFNSFCPWKRLASQINKNKFGHSFAYAPNHSTSLYLRLSQLIGMISSLVFTWLHHYKSLTMYRLVNISNDSHTNDSQYLHLTSTQVLILAT